MTRFAVLVSSPPRVGLAEAIAAGEAPRRDYFDMRDMLGAELMMPPERPGRVFSTLRKVGGNALAMAWTAWSQRKSYDVIVTDQEYAGLLLALLFKVTRTRRGHVMISHYLTPAKKQVFFRLLKVQSHIDRTICYSTAQEKLARTRLGLRADQVALVLHPADSKFWRPAASDDEKRADEEMLRGVGLEIPADAPVVCSAGLEFRDYPTLMGAASKLPEGTHVMIAASSPWSKRKNTAEDAELPENVHLVSLKPLQLRALYRRAWVAAIPLYDVDFQAGSLVAYEAMGCGKPVVITRTRGQNDIVEEGKTGFYVPPHDAEAMGGALNRLLGDPALIEEMGANSREVVERGLNLYKYLDEMCAVAREVAAKYERKQPALRGVPTP
jgi:glycosyltransferase involved in cell wall biosynthesis